MKIKREGKDEESERIEPVEIVSDDKAIVKTPQAGSGKRIPEELKEIIAIDSIDLGPQKAAEIHGVNEKTAARIRDNSDALVATIANRYDIRDLATAKLMQTLNLIDPENVEKEVDRVAIMNGLSGVIHKLENKEKEKEGRSVHLHLYAPNQKSEAEYETITVSTPPSNAVVR